MKKNLLLLCAVLLGGCASAPMVDKSLSSRSQDSRVHYLIIHYTALDLQQSLRELVDQGVSSHYLITDGPAPKIYNLVDEARRAHHAGKSSWKGETALNSSSIGIEIVNPGYRVTPQGMVWEPYAQNQIDVLIPLVRDIVQRHGIPPERVLGHSDIAPQRKEDPGPLFPWKQLADAGLVQWPSTVVVARVLPQFERQLPDLAWFQKKLTAHGFLVPVASEWDAPTRKVLAAFQMKYRPARFDGTPDAETAALLAALTGSAE